MVIEFKRNVYEMALTELARFLPRGSHANRFLRASMRAMRRDEPHEMHAPADGQTDAEPDAGRSYAEPSAPPSGSAG